MLVGKYKMYEIYIEIHCGNKIYPEALSVMWNWNVCFCLPSRYLLLSLMAKPYAV